jgi:hypothetical protein
MKYPVYPIIRKIYIFPLVLHGFINFHFFFFATFQPDDFRGKNPATFILNAVIINEYIFDIVFFVEKDIEFIYFFTTTLQYILLKYFFNFLRVGNDIFF